MQVSDYYDIDFEELLETAEEKARGGWETTFVDDLRDKFNEYGYDMFLSEKQLGALNLIARRRKLA